MLNLHPFCPTSVDTKHESAWSFNDGLAMVREYEGKIGIIDKRGDVVVPFEYDYAYPYSEGFAAVKKGEKWGYVDLHGRLITPMKFDRVGSFSEGCAAVVAGRKLGYIGSDGEYGIPPKLQYFPYCRRTNARAKSRSPFWSDFSEGLACVMRDGKWGYIDKTGEFVIEPKYDLAGKFTEGFAKVAVGNEMRYINKDGKYIWKPTR